MKSSPLSASAPMPSASVPEDRTAWFDSLAAALRTLVAAEEPLHRLGEDRSKFVALDTARQKAVEARAAVEAIFFPQGRGDIPERRDADSRRSAAMDALAEAERGRARLMAEGAGDAALDEAETAVKRAARVVEREIAAVAALDEKECAARKAALADAWDRFWPANLAVLTDLAASLRAMLDRTEKIRMVFDYVNSTGACPATEYLPYPSSEYMFVPAVIEGHLKDIEKAIWLHGQLAAKRSAAA
ncbi:MAG: hypothetical protein ACREC0_10340 [Methylocella sp.]